MYVMYNEREAVVRKQIYLTPAQNEALKRRARELGTSEAEVLRQLIDASLAESENVASERRIAAMNRFLDWADDLVRRGQGLQAGYRFDREELYAERMERLLRDRGEES